MAVIATLTLTPTQTITVTWVRLLPVRMSLSTGTSPKVMRGVFREIKTGSKTGGPVDMVLGCVDNFGARIALNQVSHMPRACISSMMAERADGAWL